MPPPPPPSASSVPYFRCCPSAQRARLQVYKKLQRLAGYTARVVELLEAVEEDSRPDERGSAVQAREWDGTNEMQVSPSHLSRLAAAAEQRALQRAQ